MLSQRFSSMLVEKLASPSDRGQHKEHYWRRNLLISALNVMLLVLIRIVSSRRFLWVPITKDWVRIIGYFTKKMLVLFCFVLLYIPPFSLRRTRELILVKDRFSARCVLPVSRMFIYIYSFYTSFSNNIDFMIIRRLSPSLVMYCFCFISVVVFSYGL